jgi:hypothetical protein
MKKSRLLASLAVIAMLAVAPVGLQLPFMASAVQAQEAHVSFSVFFTDLKPHGVWVKHAKYKYVFCPRVDAHWRPYTNGRWVYIRDRGWYFDSREPFAWAVYHYGRWVDDDRIGWCWVPGNHWAPAWVSWRRSNDYVGWAPLRPENDGFQIKIEVNIGEPPEDDWVFVPVRSFVEPELTVNIVFADRDPEIFRRTEYVGPVVIQNNVVINNVIDIDFIQQQTNQKVTVVEAQSTTDPATAQTDPASGTIQVFAPTIEEPKEEEAPPEAVEPEQAQEQLGKPPAEGEEPAATESKPADAEAAPADAAPAADAPAATECPEGQQLVDGKCVPLDAKQPAADKPAEQTDKAAPADQKAAPAEPAPEAAPADQAPAAEPAAPAEEPVKCPEGQQLVEGKCVPIEPAAEQPATKQPAEQAAPADAPPADEQAAPAEEAKPEAAPAGKATAPPCPEGQQLVKGKCVPIEGQAAPAQ